jgi:predicted ABC-type ATPase
VAKIFVLAGTNGAGKSSVGGAAFRAAGLDYFNPDEAAKRAREVKPSLTVEAANSAAWTRGKQLLEAAIANNRDLRFETTLGGDTITGLLQQAIVQRIDVHVWYVALSSPELHIKRVRARVSHGGHDIPERDIRKRYDASRRNLITLLPGLTSLRLYDNSEEADPHEGTPPEPWLLLHMEQRRVVGHCDLSKTPDWAKPILVQAFKIAGIKDTPKKPRR